MQIPHAHRGKALETRVLHTCEVYRKLGLGIIVKIPTEWVPLWDRNRKRLAGVKVERKAPVDFVGHYRGAPIAFDCKQTRGERWPFSNMPDHQIRFLNDWVKSGGAGYVLIEFIDSGEAYMVLWSHLLTKMRPWIENNRRAVKKGGGSITRQEVSQICFGRKIMTVDDIPFHFMAC